MGFSQHMKKKKKGGGGGEAWVGNSLAGRKKKGVLIYNTWVKNLETWPQPKLSEASYQMLLFLGGLKIRLVEEWTKCPGGCGRKQELGWVGDSDRRPQGWAQGRQLLGWPQALQEELATWQESFTFPQSTFLPCRGKRCQHFPLGFPKATWHSFPPKYPGKWTSVKFKSLPPSHTHPGDLFSLTQSNTRFYLSRMGNTVPGFWQLLRLPKHTHQTPCWG